jgi:hypothetical protein
MDTPNEQVNPDDEPHFKQQTLAELLVEVDELTAIGKPEAALRSLRVAFELCLRAKLAVDNAFIP